jgi:cytidine deaminase
MNIGPMTKKNVEVSSTQLAKLASEAWTVREQAYILGNTKVGCALLTEDGRTYLGCNVEHRFRCHDVHAEVNAITSMVSAGARKILALVVAAERARFTPCGSCMDWIMQFGSEDTIIAFQPRPNGPLEQYTAGQLMPFYPS